VQPNSIYFRPLPINVGHVLFMCLETVTCIASQGEIDPVAIRDHKSHYFIAAGYMYMYVHTQCGQVYAQHWIEPVQSDGKWESVTWEIRIYTLPYKQRARDRSIGIATRYGLDGPGI
jgi:hypothetical protein